MVSIYVKASPKTVSTITTGDMFPKVFFLEDGFEVASDATEETAALVDLEPSDVVWEPEDEISIVFGQDFDTCVFVPNSGKSLVVKRKIPAPVLNPAADVSVEGYPELSWTNSYQVKTRIYRTSVYATGTPTTDFTLIAEIPGTMVSGGATTYTDASISLGDETQSTSYFVVNPNGTSEVVEFTGPIA